VESYLRENETQIMVSNSILLIMERKLYGSYLASQPIVSLCLPFLLLWSIAWKNCSKIFCVFFFGSFTWLMKTQFALHLKMEDLGLGSWVLLIKLCWENGYGDIGWRSAMEMGYLFEICG
jgi:hypothetical protein